MKGERLPDGYPYWSSDKVPNPTPPGTYWKDDDGTFYVCAPNGRFGWIAKHNVIEHEDGTITVSPSILIYPREGNTYDAAERLSLVASCGEEQVREWEAGQPGWHGFLERGVWREC